MEGIDRLKQSELTGSASHSIIEAAGGQCDDHDQTGHKGEEASAASIEGIWTGEILGPYGWENSGTYVLDQGRVLGGNNRHHSAGHYSLVDNSYRAEIAVHYHGQPRAIFGEIRKQLEIVVVGTLENDVIQAQIDPRGGRGSSVRCRLIRRLDLPCRNQ